MTPQQRSREWLTKAGYLVGTVEQWTRFPSKVPPFKTVQIRKDLFGFADVIAVRPGAVFLLQVTSGANASARVEKLLNDREVAPNVLKCLQAGIRIAVHSWAKQGARGERKLWKIRVQEITAEMICVPVQALCAAEEAF